MRRLVLFSFRFFKDSFFFVCNRITVASGNTSTCARVFHDLLLLSTFISFTLGTFVTFIILVFFFTILCSAILPVRNYRVRERGFAY